MNTSGLTVLPLASTTASLELVGGKGRSLARLAAAGLPVPAGFLVSTTAYKDFVESNGLQRPILDIAADVAPHDAVSAERASTAIHALFEAATLPTETAASLTQAYGSLRKDPPAVAVRSSATAEDLPTLSFAGQQDTYLHVRGEAALLDAIRRCWASLWTARAIGYRTQMGVDQRAAAMGVVVQIMVPADVSGILFTANPSTGERSEMVVNASFGLGEAIVSGHVTPDTYVVDRTSGESKETVIGAKEEMVVSASDQGTTTRPVPKAQRRESSLSAAVLGELIALSVSVEGLFDGVPQDIEWAVADRTFWLLQSRPITNLPSPPLRDVSWDPPVEGMKLVRRQVVEHMPDPLSPLFAELYLQDHLDKSIVNLMDEMESPFDIDLFIERPLFATVNGYAYLRADYRLSWRLIWLVPQILYWYVGFLRRFLPTVIPRWRDERMPAYLATVERWKGCDIPSMSEQELLSGVRALSLADAIYWFDVSVVVGAAKVTDGLLNIFLTSRAVGGDLTSGMFLRGFPSTALQAQADLEAIATRIHEAEPLRDLVIATPVGDLLAVLTQSPQPDARAVVEELHRYLERYGHQIYTLDFAQPTQGDDPLPILLNLKMLVGADGYDTRARQAAMVEERETRVATTLESLGPLRRWVFRKLLGWAQRYGPHREEALFYVGAGWPTLRRLALELGRRLVEVGTLPTPDDVFYLESRELVDASTERAEGRACPELAQHAERRRELREARKKLHPPVMVPVKSRFKFGPFDMSGFESQKRNAVDANTLNGFAVSPGKVTGEATVIRSPADFAEMKPGTILVSPTTTPAWTPLFVQAAGLVTDIGGVLSHGSIVAREYGIPAVLGTGNITQRITTGQQITVDGDTGTVTILE